MGGFRVNTVERIEVPKIREDLKVDFSFSFPEHPQPILVSGSGADAFLAPPPSILDEEKMKFITPDLTSNVKYIDLGKVGPKMSSRKDRMGDNGAHNREVDLVVSMVTAILLEQGIFLSLDASLLRKIHDTMVPYKENGFGEQNGNVPKEAFVEIAEEVAADLILSRRGRGVWSVEEENFETALSVREAAVVEIDSLLDEVFNDSRSPLPSNTSLAIKAREQIRTRFLQDLEIFLHQMPEISTFERLEDHGFFTGRKSKILDFLRKLSRDETILEKKASTVLWSLAPPLAFLGFHSGPVELMILGLTVFGMATSGGGDKPFGWLKSLFPFRKEKEVESEAPSPDALDSLSGGPYRGISDSNTDLVKSSPESQEAWDRIEKFLRVWGWGKYRGKEHLIEYLFSPEGRRNFESYMEIGRINPHYPLPIYILATNGVGYHYAALGMLQVLLRNSATVDQLKDNIKRFGKYQNKFNLYLYELSDFAVVSFMKQTGLNSSEELRFAIKDALIGLMYDRFEAWLIDQTAFSGKVTEEFLKEVKTNDRRFHIRLDEEGDFVLDFNKVTESSSLDSNTRTLEAAKAMKEILRLLMSYPDVQVQEEAREVYYADFEGF